MGISAGRDQVIAVNVFCDAAIGPRPISMVYVKAQEKLDPGSSPGGIGIAAKNGICDHRALLLLRRCGIYRGSVSGGSSCRCLHVRPVDFHRRIVRTDIRGIW